MSDASNVAPDSLNRLLIRLWQHVTPVRRYQLSVLLGIMVLSSVFEVVSIGAVLPFLGVLSAPEVVLHNPTARDILSWLHITSPTQLLLPATIFFIGAVVFASALRMLLLWATTRLSFALGADLSLEIYQRTLYQPYVVHISRNSSEVIDSIFVKTNNVIYNVLIPCLTLSSSAILMIFVLSALYWLQPDVAMMIFGGFGLVYVALVFATKKKVLSEGEKIAQQSSVLIKTLQEGLGGVRDILIHQLQPLYCALYHDADTGLRRAQANNLFISQSPRFGMEAMGMICIALVACWMQFQYNGSSQVVPILGAFALGAQRMLPVMQQAFYGWTNIRGMQPTLKQVLHMLEQPLSAANSNIQTGLINFEHNIQLQDVSFQYNASAPFVLDQIDLLIPKGSRIGFVGATGSGKSTLLDIVMGLLDPVKGALKVDGVAVTAQNKAAWQSLIAHVPQSIFLSDHSIAENIAFGVEKNKIDLALVKHAAELAQISDAIEAMPLAYKTLVGERGVRLSGGQRQRIGIARAFYKQASVIILDEATSALDSQTEDAFMQALGKLDSQITIFMIAHRLTTLRHCDILLELDQNGALRQRTYQELVS